MIEAVVASARVVLCCGTGGVGKTTTAAAVALGAAARGRRVALVTIDPARRLADAMGLAELGNDCHPVSLAGLGTAPAGELWATMLDTKTTFDGLIVRHAASPEQAARILANPLYRNLSTTLSGTREFMAMERLYELYTDPRFDLVVVDTPPSRNALDFLEAPDRLTRFLDGQLFRMAVPGSRVVRAVSAPMLALLRRVAKVVSPEVVDDIFAFLEAFAGMEEGFRARARAVEAVLGGPSSRFVIVTTPTAAAVEESRYLAARLVEAGRAVDAIVVNRCHPRLMSIGSARLAAEAPGRGRLRDWYAAGIDLAAAVEAEAELLGPLRAAYPGSSWTEVPLLEHDVHDLGGIAEVAKYLTGSVP